MQDTKEQKKNRLAQEEVKLKLKERKICTRSLIELGGLVTKARLDHLPVNTLYGALLSLQDAVKNNDSIRAAWTVKGNSAFNQEKEHKIAVILKFEEQPNADVRDTIRQQGLMWNKFRQEWYGYVAELDRLKRILQLQDCKYNLEIITAG